MQPRSNSWFSHMFQGWTAIQIRVQAHEQKPTLQSLGMSGQLGELVHVKLRTQDLRLMNLHYARGMMNIAAEPPLFDFVCVSLTEKLKDVKEHKKHQKARRKWWMNQRRSSRLHEVLNEVSIVRKSKHVTLASMIHCLWCFLRRIAQTGIAVAANRGRRQGCCWCCCHCPSLHCPGRLWEGRDGRGQVEWLEIGRKMWGCGLANLSMC